MRKLFMEAYHNKVFTSQNEDNIRLEFNHSEHSSYFGH